ncbi:hypothetical protein KSP40_PGU019198 [Platanthera guangdongensis]|uniref:Uncharacterized protein n=1 Tax=Platanthera guangdongensis TaxID=2320717 RepID=A0ABR2M6L8_9ASPA
MLLFSSGRVGGSSIIAKQGSLILLSGGGRTTARDLVKRRLSAFNEKFEEALCYLSLLQRLDEALCFLSDNCGLAIQWLEDIVESLKSSAAPLDGGLLWLEDIVESLKSSAAPLDGGLLVVAALDKLEGEFRRLLDDHSSPLPMASSRDNTIAPGYPKANRMQIGVLNAV